MVAFDPSDEFLLEAMREVDALTPACPPIAPQPSPTWRRDEWLASLVPPDAPAAGVMPRCTGHGGCGYHHRKGIPCDQALLERRPLPPAPTRRPGQSFTPEPRRPAPPPLPAVESIFEKIRKD
jgi:hypothetical protein